MRCPQCGTTHPDSASYCAKCGAALADRDAAPRGTETAGAQQELAAGQEAVQRLRRHISPVVAEGILHDQRRLRGERREVTILFADAVNFTRLSESLDAESVFDLINDLLGRLIACVHRYDGMVDKFTGDGLMAVFGAPMVHENDPELAIRAALDMQKAAAGFEPIAQAQLGARLQIRVGIHSGPAIAGIIGTQEQMAYTVIGETVNLSARVESLARPGHVLVSFHVYQQTQGLFHFQAMGNAQVKGISRPVAVYEVLGDRSEPFRAAGVADEVTAAFVGRDAQLEQLRALFAALLDDRHGRVVVVQGEAGVGKSRLVSEWLSIASADQVAVWQGQGLPYTQGVAYSILRSLLQDVLRSHAGETEWDAQVSAALRPFLRQVSGLPLSPEERSSISMRRLEPERVKQLTTLALREWTLGEARLRPMVLVLDNFQWADELSRDVVKELVSLIDQAPVLLCVVARLRPEAPIDLAVPAREEPPGAPVSLFLALKPLPPDHGRQLLGHLIDLAGLPESLVNTILTRSEGNPFYIEEYRRMLIEKEVLTLEEGRWRVSSGVALQTLDIPSTLRGLMMARVDRLPTNLQRVLRAAAVIGAQFALPLLEEVTHRLYGSAGVSPVLARLTDLGLLVERPEAGNQVYAFRHTLAQETIYGSLLHSQRPELHRTVAECIEKLYADDLSNQAELLLLHYDRARVRDKAMHYALLAVSSPCMALSSTFLTDACCPSATNSSTISLPSTSSCV